MSAPDVAAANPLAPYVVRVVFADAPTSSTVQSALLGARGPDHHRLMIGRPRALMLRESPSREPRVEAFSPNAQAHRRRQLLGRHLKDLKPTRTMPVPRASSSADNA